MLIKIKDKQDLTDLAMSVKMIANHEDDLSTQLGQTASNTVKLSEALEMSAVSLGFFSHNHAVGFVKEGGIFYSDVDVFAGKLVEQIQVIIPDYSDVLMVDRLEQTRASRTFIDSIRRDTFATENTSFVNPKDRHEFVAKMKAEIFEKFKGSRNKLDVSSRNHATPLEVVMSVPVKKPIVVASEYATQYLVTVKVHVNDQDAKYPELNEVGATEWSAHIEAADEYGDVIYDASGDYQYATTQLEDWDDAPMEFVDDLDTLKNDTKKLVKTLFPAVGKLA